MFAAMLVAAIAAHQWRFLAWLTFDLAFRSWWFTFVAVSLAGFALGRRMRWLVLPERSGWMWRSAVALLLALSLLWLAECYWAHWIWASRVYLPLDRPLPCPDRPLVAVHDWFDAMYPVSDGSFKISGEYFRVLALVNAGVNLGCAAAGFLLGVWAEACYAWLNECESSARFATEPRRA